MGNTGISADFVLVRVSNMHRESHFKATCMDRNNNI